MIYRFPRNIGLILILVFVECKSQPTDIYDASNYELIQKNKAENFETYALKGNHRRTMQKFYWNNGTVQAISYFNDNKKDGKWQSFFEDGRLSAEAYFIEGAADSTHKTYFLNGQVATIERYSKGKKIGKWESYDTSGNLVKTRLFE